MPILFRLLSFILLSVTFFSNLFSQEIKPDHKLLWEIKGNGLPSASYLYGTIHLQDKRAFNFSDSVLLALERCHTFAMEVHPDSVVRAAFKSYIQQENGNPHKPRSKESIRKWLSEEEYDSLAIIFWEKTGFELAQFEYETPWTLEEMMRDNYIGAKDKETFLDAYLGQIARLQGKKIVGLETYQEQLESSRNADGQKEREKLLALLETDNNIETQDLVGDFLLEKLIEMYEAGRIDQIMHYYEMYAQQPGGLRYIDYMLLRRNKRMYARMLPEMHKQPTFIAVGTAHLGGEEGLIDLLKHGGYQVRPVTAVFSGLAEKYKMPKVEIPWQTYSNEAYGYSLQMPQIPFSYTRNNIAASMFLYPELGTGLVYMTMSMPLLDLGQDDEQALENIIERMCKPEGQALIKSKKIRVNGYKGRDIWIKNKEEGFIRSQIILRDQLVYLNMLESQKVKSLKGSRAKRFFNSLSFHEIPVEKWIDFSSLGGAFQLKSPGLPQHIIKEVGMSSDKDAKTKLHVFVTVDQERGNTYIFRYHDMPAGHFIPNQQVYITTSAQNLLNDMGAELLNTAYTSIDGFPAQNITFSLDGRPGSGLLCTRDNRLYILFALQYETEPQKDVEAFLNSFRLLPYQDASWQMYTAPDTSFYTFLPGQVIDHIDTSQYYFQYPTSLKENEYIAVDSNSGMSFSIYQNTYSPYFSFYYPDSFYTQILQHYEFEDNDSVVSEKNLRWNGIPVKEVILQSEDYSFIKRLRLIPYQDKLYVLWALLSREYLYHDDIQAFFEEFKLKGKNDPSLFKTRAEIRKKMLDDIHVVSANQRKVLNQSLRYFDWNAKDLPYVYATIETLLPSQDSSIVNSITILLHGLKRISNAHTRSFLLKKYAQLSDEYKLKAQILSNLAEKNEADIWREVIKILIDESPNFTHPHPSALVYPLQFQKITHVREILPELLKLMKIPAYQQHVFQILYAALEQEIISPVQLEAFEPPFQQYLRNFIANWNQAQKQEHLKGIYELCLLWQYLKMDKAAETLIRQLQNGYKPYINFAAVNALLAHQLMPDDTAISSLAANPYFRQDLYIYLDSLQHLALFPEAYKNPQAMSETTLLNYVLDEEAWEPDTVVCMGNQKVELEGTDGIVYIYKMGYQFDGVKKEEVEWYPAISGLYPDKYTYLTNTPINWMSWDVWEEKDKNEDILEKWREAVGGQ